MPDTAGAGRTRSELEDRFLAFCAERGLPLPETNQRLEIGHRKLEIDCVWREARLVVELDGRPAHRTNAAFEDTLEREIRQALGTSLPHRRRFTDAVCG